MYRACRIFSTIRYLKLQVSRKSPPQFHENCGGFLANLKFRQILLSGFQPVYLVAGNGLHDFENLLFTVVGYSYNMWLWAMC